MENTHILRALLSGFVQGFMKWLTVSSKTMNLLILNATDISVNQTHALTGSVRLHRMMRHLWKLLPALLIKVLFCTKIDD